MDKIASPQELTQELRRLLAYAESANPSRQKLAAGLNGLAGRVAGEPFTTDEKLFQREREKVEKALEELREEIAARFPSSGTRRTPPEAREVMDHYLLADRLQHKAFMQSVGGNSNEPSVLLEMFGLLHGAAAEIKKAKRSLAEAAAKVLAHTEVWINTEPRARGRFLWAVEVAVVCSDSRLLERVESALHDAASVFDNATISDTKPNLGVPASYYYTGFTVDMSGSHQAVTDIENLVARLKKVAERHSLVDSVSVQRGWPSSLASPTGR